MVSTLTLAGYFLGGLVVLGVAVWVVMLFNRVVRLRKNVDQAWSNVEVLLTQRHEEVPKLVEAVAAVTDHEREVLETVTELRTEAMAARRPGDRADREAQLAGALGEVFATAEAYPELRSNEAFLDLQERIADIETQLADRREFYNAAVTEYNTRIEQVPYNLAAAALGYSERDLFAADDEQAVIETGSPTGDREAVETGTGDRPST